MEHGATRKSASAPCATPFEQGFGLCRICRQSPSGPGLRRCAKVVAKSPAMLDLMVRAVPIAASNAPVIITGESGSGKEVLARALHASSPRRTRPFVAVNVAALPGELLESEMFGYAKGAFTGATHTKPGLIEAADGGTLMLDEIAEMPLPVQAKLLRVLEDGEVRRVGDVRVFHVDVRILCATHANLEECVEARRFREDLYHRLSVFSLEVPPLRERVEDILPMAEHFLVREGHAGHFTPAAQRALQGYFWRGNVRELANAVKHGVALSDGADVDVPHLPQKLVRPHVARGEQKPTRTLSEVERDYILRVMDACGGRQIDAARILGIGRNTLWRKLREYKVGTA